MTNSNLDTKILTGLEKFCQINRLLSWDVTKSRQISPIQAQFIEYVASYPLEARSITSLAAEFSLKKSTVSDSVKNLIDKGIFEKIENVNDSRGFFLALTQEGRDILEEIYQKNDVLLEIISFFPDDEKTVVNKFLMKLIKILHTRGKIGYVSMCLACANFAENPDPNASSPYFCKFINENVGFGDLKYNCPSFKSE